MKIAIIDDESHAVESLLITINHLYPDFQVVYKSTNPVEAITKLSDLKPDLLFLDVEMPILNGFELLKQLAEVSFEVIFTTAYSQYAAQAFKAQAANYLLKPIDEDELRNAVDCWLSKQHQSSLSDKNSIYLRNLKREGLLSSKIAVPISGGFEFIEIKDILYCQSQNNYTYIHLVNGEKVLISKTLKETEKTLEKFFFVRTHQSYLANPNYMQKFVRSDGGYLVMTDGKQIPISNSKKDLVVGIFETVSRECDAKDLPKH